MSASKTKPKTPTTIKVMDVSHPGKSAPTDTARPVIITNRPVLKDPMVVEDTAQTETLSAPAVPSAKTSTRVVIKPLSEQDEAEDKTAEAAETAKSSAADGDTSSAPVEAETQKADDEQKPDSEPAAETSANPKDETSKETEPAIPDDSKSETEVVKNEGDPTATEEELDDAAKAALEHAAAIDKLVEEHKYYLPVNSVEQRKAKHFVIAGILVSVLLGLAWADVAVDAGMVHVAGVKPVTHFFSK